MIGLIISGHGNFGSGIRTAVELISGEYEKVAYFDFCEGTKNSEVDEFYSKTIKEFGDVKNIVVLADIGGGTPFNKAVKLSLLDSKIKAISGANLPMILAALMSRKDFEDEDIDLFLAYILEEGRQGVELFNSIDLEDE